MQKAFTRLTSVRQAWHPIGDAARVRRILRLWDVLLMRRHLAELPDDGHPYWSISEILQGGQDHHANLVRQPGAAFDVVAVDLTRLRELCTSLEWLDDTLIDDHDNKWTMVDDRWVLLDDVDLPPVTDFEEADRAIVSIRAILDTAYEALLREDA